MKSVFSHLQSVVRDAFNAVGIEWDSIVAVSNQIIAFGSIVGGLNRSDSDIDILCVGSSDRLRKSGLDIQSLSLVECSEAIWLEAELATHIAAYGMWLYGSDSWTEDAKITSHTISLKNDVISVRILALSKQWHSLGEAFRKKHAVKVRRDLQRLWLLSIGQPVVPTRILDFSWGAEIDKSAALEQMIVSFTDSNLLERTLPDWLLWYVQEACLTAMDAELDVRAVAWLKSHLGFYNNPCWSKIRWDSLVGKSLIEQ